MCPFHQKATPQVTAPPPFRCPFEVRGIQDGTIMRVPLTGSRPERISIAKEAFSAFFSKPECPGLIFELPKGLLEGISSNEALRPLILPYQVDVSSASLELRLDPFLPYQAHVITALGKERATKLYGDQAWKFRYADLLMSSMTQSGFSLPTSGSDISAFLESFMSEAFKEGLPNPTAHISDTQPGLQISPGIVLLFDERGKDIGDLRNRNCFSIVRTPLYPKSFGRWSEGIEIVMSRESDFAVLSPEARRRIRTASNTVLRWHGIDIKDLAEDKTEHEGLWIPETQ